MTVRTIIKDDDPRLREVSTKVDVTGDRKMYGSLIKDLLETMQLANGVGIAAIQVGVPLRIAVVAHPRWLQPIVLINPEITSRSELLVNSIQPVRESCLSVTDRSGYVERALAVTVFYVDPLNDWKPTTRLFEGLASIIVQHELDHLDGILFIDKLVQIKPQEALNVE